MSAPKNGILKLLDHDERAEREHDLRWFASLSLEERFRIVERESAALWSMLIRGGHRRPAEVAKRPLG